MSDSFRQLIGQIEANAINELNGIGAFDWGSVINTAAEAANKGVQYDAQKKAEQKVASDSNVAAQKAITADAAWASAEQQLDLATQSHDMGRIAPAQALASQTMAAAMAAGAGLSADAQGKRVGAAQKAASAAAQAALSAPADAAKGALSRAWQKVTSGAIASGGTGTLDLSKHGGGAGGNWLTSVHGGLPVWGWGIGGVTAVTLLALIIRALRRK